MCYSVAVLWFCVCRNMGSEGRYCMGLSIVDTLTRVNGVCVCVCVQSKAAYVLFYQRQDTVTGYFSLDRETQTPQDEPSADAAQSEEEDLNDNQLSPGPDVSMGSS